MTDETVKVKVPPADEEPEEVEGTEEPETDETEEEQEEGPEEESSETDTEETQEEGEEAPGVQVSDTGVVTMPDGREVHTRTHPFPISNAEQAEYEKTHAGDQPRTYFEPGQKEYDPYTDQRVPNSHIAQMIEREIQSFPDRVAADPEASISPIWDQHRAMFDGAVTKFIETGVGSAKVIE